MEGELVKHIEDGWKNAMFSNSIFLGERLFALNPSLTNMYLLANSYFLSGNSYQSHVFLNTNQEKWVHVEGQLTSPQKNLHYLFAMVCIKLDKFHDAEPYLSTIWKHEPYDPNVNYYLGIIYRYTSRS